MIFALVLQQPTVLQDKVEKKWDVSCSIPVYGGKDSLSKFSEKFIAKKMTTDYNDFLKECKKDWVADFESAEYNFESGAVRQLGSTQVQSYTVSTYRYMGGAHGLGITECLNFGIVNGQVRQLSTWDVFRKEKRSVLAKLIMAKAKQNPLTDWLQDGETKKDLTARELGNFWIKGKAGVRWEFDAYALGSYASGPFTFEFTWNELKPYLASRNPLKSFITP